MNFFINCLKPPGMTSHDVVGYIRRLLNIKKVGHTGTLDPGATGVLPIAVGKATRAIEFLNDDKRYRCEAVLGLTTTTQDLFGEVLTYKGCQGVTEAAILNHIQQFKGSIEQIPPMYSAIKIKGKRLYQMARVGETADVPARKVNIKDLTVIDIKKQDNNLLVVLFDVLCEKGTYLRTICHDLGRSLGCGGTMSFLIRTQAGPFSIHESITLEKLQSLGQGIEQYGVSINKALNEMNSIEVDHSHLNKLKNGVTVLVDQQKALGAKLPMTVKVLSEGNEFVGIGELSNDKLHGNILRMKKTLL